MNRSAVRILTAVGRFRPIGVLCQMSSGQSGSGAGKGGGSGGAVRESGGAFGEREATQEEYYFRKLSAEQLQKLHDHHLDEIKYLEKEVKEHEESIERHKKKLKDLKKIEKLTEKDD